MNKRIMMVLMMAVFLASACRAEDAKAALSEDEKKDGWKLLFDGVTTAGWKKMGAKDFPAKGWIVEEGCLYRKEGGGGDIVTVDEFENFELSLEWKIKPGVNSGLKYRVADTGGTAFGPEMQIIDDDKHADAVKPTHRAGALYDMIVANDKKKLKPVGEFNLTKLVVKGNHVEHWLNGEKIVEYEFFSEEWKALVAKSKFKNNPKYGQPAKGRISLQDHGGAVWFKNIKIKELDAK